MAITIYLAIVVVWLGLVINAAVIDSLYEEGYFEEDEV